MNFIGLKCKSRIHGKIFGNNHDSVLLFVSEKGKILTKPRRKLLVSSEARQFGSRQFGGLGVHEFQIVYYSFI